MISIIVPIYNVNIKYLKKCLDSIKNQTNQNFELILVDDGSTINQKVCDKYAAKNVKIFHCEHGGESVSRNFGISKATGEWITFVDADDYIESYAIDMMYNTIKENNNIDICIYDIYVNYKNLEIYNSFLPKEITEIDLDELLMQMICKNYCKYFPKDTTVAVAWAKLYRKDFLIDNNLKYINGMVRMPDTIFNMYAFQKSTDIIYCPNSFYHYVKNSESVVNRFSNETIERYEKMFFETEKFLNQFNKEDIFYKALDLKKSLALIIYMESYFFNKDNPKKYKAIKKEIKELLKKPYYNNKVDYSMLNYHQKVLMFLIRHKMIFLVKQLIKIKKKIRSKEIY